ncbi:hypothetical protein [Parvibaculum sp.]|jgi:hypothetical protein|uniref:hypothetical protein n=1 Tax=Parvibaculum sp. TaxID=2024848 RepID=UPI002FD8C997
MKILVRSCLVLGLALVGISFFANGSEAQDASDPIPDCINSETNGTRPADGIAWWGRRSTEQKKYIRELPCNERYIPMVCIFLWDPDLRGCTNKGVAEYRADKECTKQGYELLSAEHVACKERFKKTFVPPFPNTTS